MAKNTQMDVLVGDERRSVLVGEDRIGQSLADLLRHEGLPLNTRCGQRGLCDGCHVEHLQGRLVHAETGQCIEADGGGRPLRGCEHRISLADDEERPLQIQLPPRSLLAHKPDVLVDFSINVSWGHDPIMTPVNGQFGVAIDVGTTTVAALLVDLADGSIKGRAAGFNRQMHLGDDVLTRINLCLTDHSMLGRLQEAVIKQTIVPLLKEALDEAEESWDRIAGVMMAGNSTMLHLVAGIDPAPMGTAPFQAVFLNHRTFHGHEVGLESAAPTDASGEEALELHLLPGAAAYVGADLCAGALASGLIYDDGPSLLVDVGTNGEILLKHDSHLFGCATAAGPAFEGAKLTSGTRAGDGAIRHLQLESDPLKVHTDVIGGGRPIGLCGSAYVDLLGQGPRLGVLGPMGRFDSEADDPDGLLVRDEKYGLSLRVAVGQGQQDILVNETDIASLLQAKAAIAAGILTLLERRGLRPEQVKRLYLAGGFGMQLDIPHSIACGLLPGFRPDQIELVGNTSLAGAYLALLDRGILEELKRISRHMEVIELNLDPGFEHRFIDQLALPS